MEEFYQGSMLTPMGKIQGKMMFKTGENGLEGYIEVNGMKSYFKNGTVENQTYLFSGTIPYFLGKINYTATATVKNNKIETIAKTNFGNFVIQGEKIS